MSVIRTARQQDACPVALLIDLQRHPDPQVADALRLPAARQPASRQPAAHPGAVAAGQRPMSHPRAQRYRVVVYERDNDHETIVMDATGNSFIAAVGTIQAGDMVGTLGDGGHATCNTTSRNSSPTNTASHRLPPPGIPITHAAHAPTTLTQHPPRQTVLGSTRRRRRA